MTTNGAISISRQILESGIWRKPSDWLRVWIFLLLAVSYQDDPSGAHKRGSGVFAWRQCRTSLPGVSKQTWQRALAWLQEEKMIQLWRIRAAIEITVCNYNIYQPVKSSITEVKTASKSPPWLLPFMNAWHDAYGGELSKGVALRVLTPLTARHSQTDILSRLLTYCARTSAAHASLPHFVATFGSWVAADAGPDPLTGRIAKPGTTKPNTDPLTGKKL